MGSRAQNEKRDERSDRSCGAGKKMRRRALRADLRSHCGRIAQAFGLPHHIHGDLTEMDVATLLRSSLESEQVFAKPALLHVDSRPRRRYSASPVRASLNVMRPARAALNRRSQASGISALLPTSVCEGLCEGFRRLFQKLANLAKRSGMQKFDATTAKNQFGQLLETAAQAAEGLSGGATGAASSGSDPCG